MTGSVLLLSIHPQHAERIFDGSKTVELRKTCPRRIAEGGEVLVYVSSPIKALVGGFEIDKIIEAAPNDLWNYVNGKAGIKREIFNNYYARASVGCGILIRNKWVLEEPVSLHSLRKALPGFTAPQSYKYFSDNEVKLMIGGAVKYMK